jgi:putative tricarboxylic transport membrane protein
MADNGLIPFGKTGPELTDFVKRQVADMQSLSREIGLIK